MNQPEIHGSSYTCTADNYDIVLDDEGTGSGIQGHCQDDLSSPPNYAPKQALAAFDGMDAAGDWVITVYDDVSGSAGTLNAWSLEIDEMGPGACGIPCEFDYECDDGAYCNGSEICSPLGKCEPGTDPCAGTATPQCDEQYDVCRECLAVEHCSDDNDCTSDICVDFICVNDLLPDGTPCAGGLGSCESGECIGRPCEGPADCDDGDWCSIDECIDNECLNTPRIYGDTDLSGVVNVFDIFCILDGIAGDFGTCSFESDDIEPCGGNGTLNLFDVFAALNAITGDDPCCGG